MPSNPAPGELELVRAFVNTRDVDSGSDEFGRAPDMAEWLSERGLLGPGETAAGLPVAETDRRRAVELREALRELMLANNDGSQPESTAVRTLNRIGERARLVVLFDDAGEARLTPAATGVDAALGRILALVYAARQDGTWPRLKACRNDTCQWGFYDLSKNRSGHWCSMTGCGSQQKARAYRQRRKGAVQGHDH